MRCKGTFGQEKPAAPAQHPWGCRISFCYSNPKSACGCPDRASHLPYPHHCVFPKARHHEHPISLRARRNPPCLRPPRSPSPEGRRSCPAPPAQGEGWVPQSLHLLTSHLPKRFLSSSPNSLLEFGPFLLVGLIPMLSRKCSQRWRTFKIQDA